MAHRVHYGAAMQALLAAVASLSLITGCSKSEPTPAQVPPAAAPAALPKQDPEAAKKLLAAGALVLDVRSPDEFAEDHLPQATNIPVDTVRDRIADVEKLSGGDKSRPIVVYCAKGGRAARAKQALEEAGFQRVVNGGGLDDLR